MILLISKRDDFNIRTIASLHKGLLESMIRYCGSSEAYNDTLIFLDQGNKDENHLVSSHI